MERITVGPFTWEGPEFREPHGEEVWTFVGPVAEVLHTHFVLKNYGNYNSDSPFSGWRLVSGGPFTQAGKWKSGGEAMLGVVDYLVGLCNERLADLRHDVAKLELALRRGT